MAPDLPADLTLAKLPDDSPADGSIHVAMAFAALDLSDVEAAGVEVDQCTLNSVNLSGTKMRRWLIRDARLERCDLANLRARECDLSRVAIASSRMTGLSWLDGRLRDVTLTDCRMDLASFRSSAFSDVLFSGCRLTQAEFGDADLTGARFENCDLTGAQFSAARMAGTRLVGCDLTGIDGVTSLRGAVITSGDARMLAVTLAAALGITIEDE
jgi:uncharacterized protein YjbI with pentapeptide repeats